MELLGVLGEDGISWMLADDGSTSLVREGEEVFSFCYLRVVVSDEAWWCCAWCSVLGFVLICTASNLSLIRLTSLRMRASCAGESLEVLASFTRS